MMLFTSWDGKTSTAKTNELLLELSRAHLAACGEIRKPDHSQHAAWKYIADCVAGNRISDLCNLDLDVRQLQPLDAYHLGQVSAFFRKRVDVDNGIDREAVAYLKFLASERKCRETNTLFRAWDGGRLRFYPHVEAALDTARWKISKVLGECPSLEKLHFHFGPGATTQVLKRDACAKRKLSQQVACSAELATGALARVLLEVPHVYLREEEGPDWSFTCPIGDESRYVDWVTEHRRNLTLAGVRVDCEVHPGNLSFVPKSAKEDRAIVVEPWLNSFCQLGIGEYIAQRLKQQVGIDLRDQERNKNLARDGSITGALATLDLSSASDTIALELVKFLLPPDWYALLRQFRTGRVEYSEASHHLEKFSSMGNGFTFPLETLIFWALLQSSLKKGDVCSVYGDDIICPTHCAELIMQILEACGFQINKKKSFWDGPFRESCGGDYLSGIDIRPCFITDRMSGHDAFRLHNFYVRSWLPDLALCVRRTVHEEIRLFGPDGYGDGHLLGDWGGFLEISGKRISHGYGGATFDTWCYSKRTFSGRLPGDRVLPVYSIYSREGAADSFERTLTEDRIARSWLLNQEPDLKPNTKAALGYRFLRNGTPVETLPGSKGCKRISIYTFER